MEYTINNLTDNTRNENPNHNDLLRYNYSNGTVVEKIYFNPILTTEELEIKARVWRNLELRSTDFIVPLTDYPNHAAWITYRQELRDWTVTEDFPNTKPIAPAEL